jgi:hypothetical protein
MKKSFWHRILDKNDSASSKRLVTLVVALHFILSSFTILFLVCYIALAMPKGKIDAVLLSAFGKILEYDFYIIVSGLAFVTSEGLVQMIVSKYQQNTGFGNYPTQYPTQYPIGEMPQPDVNQPQEQLPE